MKRISDFFISLCCALLYGCGAGQGPGLKPGQTTIVLQPLNHFDQQQLHFLREDLQRFYHKNVVIQPVKTIPVEFIDLSKGKRYSAPKVIRWLMDGQADSIVTVAGLTSEDIFTTKKDSDGKVKKPESKYAVWGIFGLGYCPGSSCVISDNRLRTADATKFRRRLRTVVIHEIGHNLGLPHCTNGDCIMSDAHEKMATVDSRSTDYCQDCKKKAGMQE
jgi:archaemetzincin